MRTAAQVEIDVHRQYALPLTICLAANRVQRRYERQLGQEWGNGIAAALSAVLVAGGLVWAVMR
jgi:hypothetical protein